MTCIGDFPAMASGSVYRRSNGELFLKLDEARHVQVQEAETEEGVWAWVALDEPEQFDATEEVEAVRL